MTASTVNGCPGTIVSKYDSIKDDGIEVRPYREGEKGVCGTMYSTSMYPSVGALRACQGSIIKLLQLLGCTPGPITMACNLHTMNRTNGCELEDNKGFRMMNSTSLIVGQSIICQSMSLDFECLLTCQSGNNNKNPTSRLLRRRTELFPEPQRGRRQGSFGLPCAKARG